MKYATLGIALLALGFAILSYFRSAPTAFGSVSTATARGGISGYCDPGSANPLPIYASFNNVNSKNIKLETVNAGHSCFVKFPFRIEGHVALASSSNMVGDQIVAVHEFSNKTYEIAIYTPGVGYTGGPFHLVVY